MVEVTDQRIQELTKAGAFKAGGVKLLQSRFGYSPTEASDLYNQYAYSGKVYGRRSQGIPDKPMIVTTGEIGPQYLEPVRVVDTNKGAVTIRYSPRTNTPTSVREENIINRQIPLSKTIFNPVTNAYEQIKDYSVQRFEQIQEARRQQFNEALKRPMVQQFIKEVQPVVQPIRRFVQEKVVTPYLKGQTTGARIEYVNVFDQDGRFVRTESVLVPINRTKQEEFLRKAKIKIVGENLQKILPYRRYLKPIDDKIDLGGKFDFNLFSDTRTITRGQGRNEFVRGTVVGSPELIKNPLSNFNFGFRLPSKEVGIGNIYPEDIVLGGAGLAASGGLGLISAESFGAIKIPAKVKYGTSVVFSKKITDFSSGITDLFQPESQLGKFGKGYGVGYVTTARLPTVGVAYGTELLKGLFLRPSETISGIKQFAKESPAEFSGMLAGGSARVRSEAERLGRRSLGGTEFKVEIFKTNYGDVKIIDTQKYGKIAYVEGKFAQSEKLERAKQLSKSKGVNRVVFTQASAQAIPLSQTGKGSGFTVIQGKPLRGFYEAPPLEFLRQLGQQVQGVESGIYSFYLNAQSRSLLGNPFEGLTDIFTGKAELGNARPSVQLRRASYPQTDKWIYETSNSLESSNKIPTKYSQIINKYYQRFLAEPFTDEFLQGRVLVGKEKLDHINKVNLKGKGTGNKLKFYAALLQFQKENIGKQLIGGAEVLSTIQPYGPESQIVTGIGTKFYRRSLTDLRKAKRVTPFENIIAKVTGVQRGQAFSMIEGGLVEFEFFRAGRKIDRRLKQKVKGKIEPVTNLKEDIGIDLIENQRVNKRYRLPSAPRVQARRTQIVSSIPNILTRETRRNESRRGFEVARSRSNAQRKTRATPTNRVIERVLVRPIERRPEPRVPRRTTIPNPVIETLIARPRRLPDKYKKKVKKEKVSKERPYILTANIRNVLTGQRRTRPIKLSELSGFESLTI